MFPELLSIIVGDGGPVYWETGRGIWLAEDVNAISSLFYLIPACALFVKALKC